MSSLVGSRSLTRHLALSASCDTSAEYWTRKSKLTLHKLCSKADLNCAGAIQGGLDGNSLIIYNNYSLNLKIEQWKCSVKHIFFVCENLLYYCCIFSSWHPLLVPSDWQSLLIYPGRPLFSTNCAALQSTIEIEKTQPTISILIWVTRTSFDCRMKVAWLALSITLTKPLFVRLFMNFTRKRELFTHHSDHKP